MDHNAIRHLLSEYIDGAVSPEDKAEIEAHLKTCQQCQVALTELQKTIEQVKQVEEVAPPAWMTQKIMAQVREEAEKKRSIFQRLFYPLGVKLPLEAVGMVFLIVTAFYVYRGMQPTTKYAEPRAERFDATKQAPPTVAENTLQREKEEHVPQKPGYKSLDMKSEYAEPEPPVPADKVSPPPAPAKKREQPVVAEKNAFRETPAAAPQAAPSTAEGQAAGPSLSVGRAREFAAPAQRTAKAKEVATASPRVILRTEDIEAAAREVEQATAKLEGTILRKEFTEAKKTYTISVNSQKLPELTARLKHMGEIKDETGALASKDSMIEIIIDLEKKK